MKKVHFSSYSITHKSVLGLILYQMIIDVCMGLHVWPQTSKLIGGFSANSSKISHNRFSEWVKFRILGSIDSCLSLEQAYHTFKSKNFSVKCGIHYTVFWRKWDGLKPKTEVMVKEINFTQKSMTPRSELVLFCVSIFLLFVYSCECWFAGKLTPHVFLSNSALLWSFHYLFARAETLMIFMTWENTCFLVQ